MKTVFNKFITILLAITMLAAIFAASSCANKNTGGGSEIVNPDPGGDPSEPTDPDKPDPSEPEKPDPSEPDKPAAEPKFEDNVETIELSDSLTRKYLSATTDKEEFEILAAHAGETHDVQTTVKITANGGKSPYTLKIADNKEMKNAEERTSSDGSFTAGGTFMPNGTYYYEVVDSDKKAVKRGTVKTGASFLRIINVAGARNVRDLGGWATETDGTVNYGKLYRGGKLNPREGSSGITSGGVKTLRDDLKIKTEIDLRNSGDDGGQTACQFDSTANYYKLSIGQYDRALTGSKTNIKQIFSILADESNYPVYFHCNAGADRTGTIAYLVSGLLGVNYRNLTKDFELTSFGGQGNRWRSAENEDGTGFDNSGVMQNDKSNYVAWGVMHEYIVANCSGDTLADKIETYLLGAGVTENEINSLRAIMLNLTEDETDEEAKRPTCVEDGVKVYTFAGKKMKVVSPAIGHDFTVSGDKATCKNCSLTVDYKAMETDVDTGAEFSSLGAVSAVKTVYGKSVAYSGKMTFEKKDASDAPKSYLITAGGKDTLVSLTVWSKIVKTQADLLALNDYLVKNTADKIYTGYFTLGADITLDIKWQKTYSIGYDEADEYVFNGTFFGNGKKIENFVTTAEAGLIYKLGALGCVKDLTLKGETEEKKSQFLCASACGGRIENVTCEVKLNTRVRGDENSALLGKIGKSGGEIEDIYLKNVTVIYPDSTKLENFDCSCAIGRIYASNVAEKLKIDGLSVVGMKFLMIDGTDKYGIDGIKKLLADNAKNVAVYKTYADYIA